MKIIGMEESDSSEEIIDLYGEDNFDQSLSPRCHNELRDLVDAEDELAQIFSKSKANSSFSSRPNYFC